jgi:hypothetical protein
LGRFDTGPAVHPENGPPQRPSLFIEEDVSQCAGHPQREEAPGRDVGEDLRKDGAGMPPDLLEIDLGTSVRDQIQANRTRRRRDSHPSDIQ